MLLDQYIFGMHKFYTNANLLLANSSWDHVLAKKLGIKLREMELETLRSRSSMGAFGMVRV